MNLFHNCIDNMVTRKKLVNHDAQIFNTGFGFYINPITGNTKIFWRLRTQFSVWTTGTCGQDPMLLPLFYYYYFFLRCRTMTRTECQLPLIYHTKYYGPLC